MERGVGGNNFKYHLLFGACPWLTNAFSKKQSVPLTSYHMWHPSLRLSINPGLLRYDQIMPFATAMLNSVYKAKCTTKRPPGAPCFAIVSFYN